MKTSRRALGPPVEMPIAMTSILPGLRSGSMTAGSFEGVPNDGKERFEEDFDAVLERNSFALSAPSFEASLRSTRRSAPTSSSQMSTKTSRLF